MYSIVLSRVCLICGNSIYLLYTLMIFLSRYMTSVKIGANVLIIIRSCPIGSFVKNTMMELMIYDRLMSSYVPMYAVHLSKTYGIPDIQYESFNYTIYQYIDSGEPSIMKTQTPCRSRDGGIVCGRMNGVTFVYKQHFSPQLHVRNIKIIYFIFSWIVKPIKLIHFSKRKRKSIVRIRRF